MTDIRDVSRCPRGCRCESCGRNDDPQVVARVYEPTGEVFCITLCPRCRTSAVPPQVREVTAGRFIAQHRAHVAGRW